MTHYHTLFVFGDLGTQTDAITNLTSYKHIPKYTTDSSDLGHTFMPLLTFLEQVKLGNMIPLTQEENHCIGILRKDLQKYKTILHVSLSEMKLLLDIPEVFENSIFIQMLHKEPRTSFSFFESHGYTKEETLEITAAEKEEISSLPYVDYILYINESIPHSLCAKVLNHLYNLACVSDPKQKGTNRIEFKDHQWAMLKVHD